MTQLALDIDNYSTNRAIRAIAKNMIRVKIVSDSIKIGNTHKG